MTFVAEKAWVQSRGVFFPSFKLFSVTFFFMVTNFFFQMSSAGKCIIKQLLAHSQELNYHGDRACSGMMKE